MERDELIQNGWRRHSVILPEETVYSTLLNLLPTSQKEFAVTHSAIAIIATYDCAIINPDTEAEPWLHILLAFEVQREKKFCSGRDPRRIHFEAKIKGKSLFYETNAACIAQIERTPIVSHICNSNNQLPAVSQYDLKNWLAERFKLSTWPDSFNQSLRPATKKLKAFWKRYNDFVSSLYIHLNTHEEVDAEQYSISAIVAFEDGKQRQFIKKIREQNKQLNNCTLDEANAHVENEVANIFSSCVTINKDPTSRSKLAIAVMEEKSITVSQLRKFSRFSPYSLSEFEDGSPLPVDMLSNK